jgi:hypothetical protein
MGSISRPAISLIMKSRLLLLAPLIALLFSACAGYKIGPTKPHHLDKIVKLAVPTFSNETLEPRLSVLLTNSVIKQLQADGTYQIGTVDGSDAVLECTIRNINRSQFRAVRTNVLKTSELRVELSADYRVKQAGTELVLHSGRVFGASNIVLDPNFQLSEHQAMEVASTRLAQQLVTEISEGW